MEVGLIKQFESYSVRRSIPEVWRILTDPELKAQIVTAGQALRPPVTDAEVGVWFRAGRTGSPRR